MKIKSIVASATHKTVFFAVFSALLLCGAFLLQTKPAHATAGKGLVLDQTVELDPSTWTDNLLVDFASLGKVVALDNDEYLAIGNTRPNGSGVYVDALVVKYADTDNDGDYQVSWYQHYEVKTNSNNWYQTSFSDAVQLSDGSIVVAGTSQRYLYSSSGNEYRTIIVKYNPDGTVAASDYWGGTFRSLTVSDNDEIFLAVKNAGDSGGKIYKYSSDLSYGDRWMNGYDDSFFKVISHGNYTVIGIQNKNLVKNKILVRGAAQYDIDGEFQNFAISSADNTIIVTGRGKISKYNITDGSLVKTIPTRYNFQNVITSPNGSVYVFGGTGSIQDSSYGGGYPYSMKLDNSLDMIYPINVGTNDGTVATDSGLVVPGGSASGNNAIVKVHWYNEVDGFDYSTIDYVITPIDEYNTPTGITYFGPTTVDSSRNFTPNKPTAEGFTFKGWYTDPELTTPFADGTTVSSDMTLYGSWERNQYTISFSWGSYSAQPEGVTLPEPIQVYYQESIDLPALEKVTGYTERYENNISHINSVTSDRTVQVLYTKNQYNVSFVTKTTDNPASYSPSSAFDPQRVYYQDKATFKNPTANGYAFKGYFEDEALSRVFDQNTPIVEDTVIYVGWVNTSLIVKDSESGGLELVNADPNIAYIDDDGNVVLDGYDGYKVDVQTDKDITIVLKNDNTSNEGIGAANSNVTITGDGSFSGNAIGAKDLTIDDTTVTAKYIESINDITIKDGEVAAQNIVSGNDINIENSSINGETEGNRVSMRTINGDITIKDSSITEASIESSTIGSVVIEDSTVTGNSIGGGDSGVSVVDSTVTLTSGIGSRGDATISNSTVSSPMILGLDGDIIIDNSDVDSSSIYVYNDGDIYIINGSEVNLQESNEVDSPALGNDGSSLYIEDSIVNVSTGNNWQVKDISIKDGEFNVIVDNNSEDPIQLVAESITLDGGKANLYTNKDMFQFPAIWVKDGDFNVKTDEASTALFTYLTQVDGGSLNVTGNAYNCSMATLFAIFNGGETKISTNAEITALCVDLVGNMNGTSSDMAEYVVEGAKDKFDIDLEKGKYVVFNGGDIVLEADLASMIVFAGSEKEANGSVVLGKGMVADSDTKAQQSANLDTIEADTELYIRTFNNGKKARMDGEMPVNLASYTHIHPYVPPVIPSVPNTVDYDILVLASAVFISVMVQGMVIADLYRRMHGYEEEIAAEKR